MSLCFKKMFSDEWLLCGALGCSVKFNSLQSHGLLSTRLLCPWNFTGNNTGTDYYFLLQGIFPTQGSNPCLLPILHWQADSLPLCHLGSPQWLLLLSRFSHVQLCATPQEPTRLPRPWDSPGKNTGVGCHFLLQCVEVKLLSRVQLLVTV